MKQPSFMPSSITFILPNIFNDSFVSQLDESSMENVNSLAQLLKRAKVSEINSIEDWLKTKFKLKLSYSNSASQMAMADGLTVLDNEIWLRADPVMLSATHNGILCRGNRVLKVTKEERKQLELLFNEYLDEYSFKVFLSHSSRGYLKIVAKPNSTFCKLNDVLGQDITHRLPKGDDEKIWHSLITDLQMLLHNCEVNQLRLEAGKPSINGLWLWAEDSKSIKDKEAVKNDSLSIYTDDPAMAGALGIKNNLHQLEKSFVDLVAKENVHQQDIVIQLADFYQSVLQDDKESSDILLQHWTQQWILPALKAVTNKTLAEVKLVIDDKSYELNTKSFWYFWRNNTLVSTS